MIESRLSVHGIQCTQTHVTRTNPNMFYGHVRNTLRPATAGVGLEFISSLKQCFYVYRYFIISC